MAHPQKNKTIADIKADRNSAKPVMGIHLSIFLHPNTIAPTVNRVFFEQHQILLKWRYGNFSGSGEGT